MLKVFFWLIIKQDEAKRKTAKEEWMKIFSQIQCLLRQGASKCLEKGLFDAKLKHKYFMSGIALLNANHLFCRQIYKNTCFNQNI